MHDLALALVGAGHEVTYLTMRHWDDEPPALPGVEVVGLVPAGAVYADEPALARAAGCGSGSPSAATSSVTARRFDVVHTAAFPYFPHARRGLVRRRGRLPPRRRLVRGLDAALLAALRGRVVGTAGWLVQRRCVRVRHRAFCISRLTERRLVEEGFAGDARRPSRASMRGRSEPSPGATSSRVVVYAGRHVREKRVPLLVEAFARGPSRSCRASARALRRRARPAATPRQRVDAARARGRRRVPRPPAAGGGRAARSHGPRASRRASEREGYGLVVVEAAARGTPSVVVAGAENAAVELVDERRQRRGRPPTRRRSRSAQAIVEVVRGGAPPPRVDARLVRRQRRRAAHRALARARDAELRGREPVDDASAEHRDALEHATPGARRSAGRSGRRRGRETPSSGRRPGARPRGRLARTRPAWK